MKNTILILVIEFLISGLIALISSDGVFNYDYFTLLGLCNLIIGVIGVIIGLIISILDKENGKILFIASGLLLLLGCLTCSIFPFQMNSPHSR